MKSKSPGIGSRLIASILLMLFVSNVTAPYVAMSLTSGPPQPEFSNFEPVSTNGMVNEFTGAFTYNIPVVNIPGTNGSGYSMSLSYHSGSGVEEEASWVGLGWTLNPGSITRNKRGFPDDWKDVPVTYYNQTTDNHTASVSFSTGFEAFSVEKLGVDIGKTLTFRWNNKRGFSYVSGLKADVGGIASMNYGLSSDGDESFDWNINPGSLLSMFKSDKADNKLESKISTYYGYYQKLKSILDASNEEYPTTSTEYSGFSINARLSGLVAPSFFPVGTTVDLSGTYAYQSTPSSRNIKTNGYMYSAEGENDPNSIMDYYVEKRTPFKKKDVYLGIPFSDADQFSVSGEGIGGSFRLYNKGVGQFRPNSVSNPTGIFNYQYQQHIHLTNPEVGWGFMLGAGLHTLDIDGWDADGYHFKPFSDNNESVFFRFDNDMGGSVNYAPVSSSSSALFDGDAPSRASMITSLSITPSLSTSGIYQFHNNNQRSGRASLIAYHTVNEMKDHSSNVNYNRFDNSASSHNKFNSWEIANVDNSIGEFDITNQDGMHYTYGLPVYSFFESDMRYGLKHATSIDIQNRHQVYANIDASDDMIGNSRPYGYAANYLVTQITTPDYLDRLYDGPTADDFGGYVKFTYSPTALSTWAYHWRMPYNGMNYLPGSLTTGDDDYGQVSEGYKQMFFLETVETKSHVAVFVTNKMNKNILGHQFTGTNVERKDAYEAKIASASILQSQSDATAATSSSAANKQRFLERIEVWSKGNDGKLKERLSTTHFEYDYSLCQGVPNSQPNGETRYGKLTLKRVWFDYQNVVNAKFSPYSFDYEYSDPSSSFPSSLSTKYASLFSEYSGLSSGEQNPDYSPFNTDRWGNYQANGSSRHADDNPWVDQTPTAADFDPAAYHLKHITLPSGGEIFVQYEQNDYRYVQDRTPMTMVHLDNPYSLSPGDDYYKYFYANVTEDLGLNSTEANQLKDICNRMFVQDKQKMYFKFLHALRNNDEPSLTGCSADYIYGYVSIASCSTVTVGSNTYLKFEVPVSDHSRPVDVCKDYAKKWRTNSIGEGFVCKYNAGSAMGSSVESSGANPTDDSESFGNSVIGILQTLFGMVVAPWWTNSFTPKMDFAHSYLRLPMLKDKKGGGIRVKRVLLYDSGIESGAKGLYGSEYSYVTEDGRSSGVATNEPTIGREENALITYLQKRYDEDAKPDKAISGNDLEQLEGPIGESILPSPSVGYARVVSRNIHSGKSSPGFVVNEYFTVKDYPFDKDYSTSPTNYIRGNQATEILTNNIPIYLNAFFFTYYSNNVHSTQGYRFIRTEMHGQLKRSTTFSGQYTGGAINRADVQEIAKVENVFFEPGEKVPVFDGIHNPDPVNHPEQGAGYPMQYLGKEMEVVNEGNSVKDISTDLHANWDISIMFLPSIPFFNVSISSSGGGEYTERELYTYVTNKIVRYPAIVKSVTTLKDGVTSRVDNIAFDPATAAPLVTRTIDGFNNLNLAKDAGSSPAAHPGTYYTYNFPAHQQYDAMGQKSTNDRLTINFDNNISVNKVIKGATTLLNIATLATSGVDLKPLNDLSPGDLIRVWGENGIIEGIYHVKEVKLPDISLTVPGFASRLGSGSIAKSIKKIEVLCSGKTNQLNTSSGMIRTYGEYHAPESCYDESSSTIPSKKPKGK